MISVIVPVYNVQRYLPQCIDSIIMQDYRDIEVLLVNDASTDDSLKICKQYAGKDNRIKIIDKKENEGVDKARFTGLDFARGEYVAFVDSDDWLEGNDTLNAMLKVAQETDVDYVQVASQRVMDKYGFIKKKRISHVLGLIESPELFNNYYLSFFGYNILCVGIWGKLYKRQIIDKALLKPSGLSMGEDLYFNMILFPYLKSIYIMDKVGYNYRFGGMTSRYNPHLLPDLKALYKVKDNLIDKYNYSKAYDFIRIELKNVFRSDICQLMIYNAGNKDFIIDKIIEELSDPVYNEIQKVKEHPNFLKEPFVIAMAQKDAFSIYDQCLEIVKKNRFERNLKKIAGLLLKCI